MEGSCAAFGSLHSAKQGGLSASPSRPMFHERLNTQPLRQFKVISAVYTVRLQLSDPQISPPRATQTTSGVLHPGGHPPQVLLLPVQPVSA